ncbi:hypothetical protein M2T79_02510 [Elizabethkingia miricola]|uniref:hypothetical protein n=1 Tax=Elizabethkingia miricola TaxID=172045 RepID=UPI002018733E|nr:hypothetical protein [Elizabethkingia miricola]MCL1655453.1 hypothetical protein [Elizabethkingia miricola]
MKVKYIEIIDLVLSNPANQLSKSSRDMLETMKNGLKIEKINHLQEMTSMLEECLGKLPINTDSQVTFYKKVEQLILKIKE